MTVVLVVANIYGPLVLIKFQSKIAWIEKQQLSFMVNI